MTESYTNSIRILDIKEGTTVDGPGFRLSIYCAGCSHHCPGCHNPQSWDCEQGTLYTVDELFERVVEADLDVTFTGGDPMLRPEGFIALARRIRRETDKNIWCYTGFTYEQIQQDERRRALLELVDVLVDGRFEQQKRDLNLLFKGSWNQRLVDVRRSVLERQVVVYEAEF